MTEPGEALPPADLDTRPLIAMRKPPPATIESLPHAHPPRPVLAPTMPERDVMRPDVQISIGRLEVRAHVAAPTKVERPAPFRPQLTLQDYLARRSGGH
jgi:hypothetical protein